MGGLRFSDAIRKKEKKTKFRFGAPSVAKDISSSDDKPNGGRQGKSVHKISSRKAKKLPPSMVAERGNVPELSHPPATGGAPPGFKPRTIMARVRTDEPLSPPKSINPATGRGRIRRLTPPETKLERDSDKVSVGAREWDTQPIKLAMSAGVSSSSASEA